MRKTVTGLVVAGALLSSVMVAQRAPQQDVDLQAAIRTETVDGDLRGAIALYGNLAKSSDRALAVQALVRMAGAYQKLGDTEARNIYERIVREFPDRKEEVALARARLGGPSAAASAKGDRAVWTGPNVDPTGRVSPDGRFITYVDWNNGRLMIHDVAANVDRALTPAAPNYSQQAEGSAISKDGKQVAYVWLAEKGVEFRIAALPGSGFLEPRRLNTDWFSPLDWSADGKWIAAWLGRTGEIGLITVADGSFRSLKSVGRNLVSTANNRTSIRFSPDGKHIAYDRPSTDTSLQRDVFVLAIDGGREIPAVVHSANDAVMGWSPDGTRPLFSSDRTGTVGLWAQPFSDGTPQGSPELLKSDIGSSFSLGLTASGALYVYKSISSRDIAIAPIDLEAGKLLGPPVSFIQGFVDGAGFADWSPDGKYLAYPVTSNNGCVAIRSVATGQVRRLAHSLSDASRPRWSPDGRTLLAKGHDVRGREGIFQIDAQSGEATAVILGEVTGLAEWSPDGKKVYFSRFPARGVVVERDLASGSEREVRGGDRSPDGQYVALRRQDPSTKTASLLVAPFAGGEPREVVRLTQPEVFEQGNVWTPDSSAVMVVKNTGARRELWLVPVAGGRPRKLDINPDIWLEGSRGGWAGFSLSPDGRSIAFQMGKAAAEVWALENFLPAPSAKR